jgi:hypothetical protein
MVQFGQKCRFSLFWEIGKPLKPTPEENQRHFGRAMEAMKAFSDKMICHTAEAGIDWLQAAVKVGQRSAQSKK